MRKKKVFYSNLLVVASTLYLFLFTFIYKPFGLLAADNKFLLEVSALTGGVVFLLTVLILLIIHKLQDRMLLANHIYWKPVCITILMLAFTSCTVYFLYPVVFPVLHPDFFDVLVELSIAAVAPLLGALYYAERVELRELHLTAELLSRKVGDAKHALNDKILNVSVESSTGNFEFLLSEIIAIEASDNYCTFYLFKGEKLNKSMQRVSLKSISEQLDGEEDIFRCHRSFMVNLNFFEKIHGNAKGYRMKLANLDFEVPVSRNIEQSVLKELKQKSE
ncbi:MAG: LytTR family transcriptional regulator [Bacteroidetes bacterium]|nr:LytTR family transcriptional regulator [Bacteroidota bacterium]MBU1719470.1 LytTR family transcriptional regulator [Bacteroidota bacterium]